MPSSSRAFKNLFIEKEMGDQDTTGLQPVEQIIQAGASAPDALREMHLAQLRSLHAGGILSDQELADKTAAVLNAR